MVKRKSVFRNSKRVYGVDFHPTRPRWVSLSTVDGFVKIIEYKLNKMMK